MVAAGETNGKSNNLNNCLKNVVYKDYYPMNPQGPKIPKTEVMVVFDADMVAKPNFFTKILEVMEDDDVALCLTPQVGFQGSAQLMWLILVWKLAAVVTVGPAMMP
jgi:cellulose synthase/poly-beta-1,6-N-acetylglucosamine synthase-like glycosyltransferase